VSLEKTIEDLPSPLRESRFHLLQRGVYDSPETDVYIDEEESFAFLCPRPEVDYVRYKPRVKTLELTDYKKSLAVVERRFEKVRAHFRGARNVLEIGAGDGSFLVHVRSQCPDVALASQEIDHNTRAARDAIPGLTQHESLDEARASGERYDLICMFHVLEHVFDPGEFLADAAACLAPGGRLIIEVPSLRDPLLSLYACEAYRRFYFQRQHPYVYSASSLSRLFAHLGLEVEQAIDHQRYGLENHLHWLSAGKPGGSEALREIFGSCEDGYLRALERAGHADSFIGVVRLRP
jgi:2-polyprenyl-3-methyl-5-hydroxy-6-metoxy-1,4-benzoquinol methylase